jgi:hypothetical protein
MSLAQSQPMLEGEEREKPEHREEISTQQLQSYVRKVNPR